MRINSNSISALAYGNLSKSQFNLQTTLERLSSGLRINKAADDSAGSAISTRMNNQIQGMKQANENAQQANNLIQTAENGLNDISGMLSRMRELAVQAATDTLNDTDRSSINLEYQALKNEVTRLANVTEYNEMDILNGTYYRNQVDTDISTADDVSGSSIQALDDVIKGAYTLQDALATDSNGALIDAVVTDTAGNSNISWISADGDVTTGDYRLSLKSDGYIKLEKTSDGGSTWALASSDTISADSVSQNSTFTFQTTNGKDVTVTFPDSDSDGVLDFKDSYPDNVSKVKDLPSAFSGLSGNLKLWLDSREWSAIETDGTNASNWIDFSGKANHIGQSTTSETLNVATMIVVTKAGALTPTDSNAGGIQLSDSSVYDEVLVFDRVLTGTEKTQINDYLTNKWGLNTGSGSVILTFTNAGATGQYGPTQADVDTAYSGTPLDSQVTVSNGIQDWIVPVSETYTIEAYGAQGGQNSSHVYGKGAKIIGEFTLQKDETLSILVGQVSDLSAAYGKGGGGGSFVWEKNTEALLVAAGGGAGASNATGSHSNIVDGQSTVAGGSHTSPTTPGYGGNVTNVAWAGGGGSGWYSNGASVSSSYTWAGGGGIRPLEGGSGGDFVDGSYVGDPYGGFGGGGGSGVHLGGGGGGYTGGEGGGYEGSTRMPGGGGSYNSGGNQVNSSGVREGHGLVKISYDATSPGTHSNTVDSAPDQVLSNFTVSSNRALSLTDADGNSQRKDYVSSNQETLGFSDFGIQVDLASDYDPSNSLHGKGVEIAAGRDLQVGADNDINHQLQLGISSVTANGLRISGSAVVDIDQARAAITSLDHATDMVNQERSYLGSMQNRLSFTMSNLASQIQNIEASRSSIQDADFASEAMNLSRSQILSQSSSAMLAQANALTQNILGLLR